MRESRGETPLVAGNSLFEMSESNIARMHFNPGTTSTAGMDEGDEQDMTAAGNGNVGDDASPPSLRYPDPFIEYLLYIGGASLRCSRAATSCVWALLVVVTPILVLWLFLRKAYANEVDKAYAEESIAIGASLWLARMYDFYVAVGYPRKVNAREVVSVVTPVRQQGGAFTIKHPRLLCLSSHPRRPWP